MEGIENWRVFGPKKHRWRCIGRWQVAGMVDRFSEYKVQMCQLQVKWAVGTNNRNLRRSFSGTWRFWASTVEHWTTCWSGSSRCAVPPLPGGRLNDDDLRLWRKTVLIERSGVCPCLSAFPRMPDQFCPYQASFVHWWEPCYITLYHAIIIQVKSCAIEFNQLFETK